MISDFAAAPGRDMKDIDFGNYRQVIYLAQTGDPARQKQAAEIATRLGLAYAYRHCGYGDLAASMAALPAPPVPA